jgi:hypothetical protein
MRLRGATRCPSGSAERCGEIQGPSPSGEGLCRRGRHHAGYSAEKPARHSMPSCSTARSWRIFASRSPARSASVGLSRSCSCASPCTGSSCRSPPLLQRMRRPVDTCGLHDDNTLEIALPEAGEEPARRIEATLLEGLREVSAAAASGCANLAGPSGSADELHERALLALKAGASCPAPRQQRAGGSSWPPRPSRSCSPIRGPATSASS